MDQKIFVNKAEASGIIAFDLLDYQPSIEIVELDIKEHLFMGMIVKEKEFKESLTTIDFSAYDGKAIAVVCSADAIIPPWAYMLLTDKLSSHASSIDLNNTKTVQLDFWKKNLNNADLTLYKNQKVVIRASADIDPSLYILATSLLKPFVKSLMYGEIGMPKVIFKN
ncbi:hypothetical protein IQ37_16990 [Chryseobacterium piperi]|uniref:DUF2480 family protein n=1 Tax=Chryseobacterium piperi TaxID=558152 RepID=A0A086ALY5_9FLAO|nr:DUF2480 family protein [Chryseobacterium piperi]ASW73958.1 DUF2480 domain-containing protein [Chryseobacterium piperi]KFF17699.1 hypothetical protein IQ37_16990 [Chryseobacterium piperi]